jgi:tetratricopeptide (TPR) repeat protein
LITPIIFFLATAALVPCRALTAHAVSDTIRPSKILAEARSIASDIQDPLKRWEALEQIVTAQISLAPLDARETLKKFPKLPNRLNHLAALALAYAKAGNIEETERMYAEIRLEDRGTQQSKLATATARGAIAVAFANAGKFDDAFRTVSQLREQLHDSPPAIVESALGDIAAAQAKHGDTVGAVRTATGIASANPQVLIGLVAGRVRAGDLPGAQQIVAGLDEGLQRYAQWGIVQGQRDRGRPIDAQITASAISPGHAKASALLELAQHHLKSGNKSNAVGLLQEAATAAGSTMNEWAKADVLWRIAGAMAEAGELFTAMDTARGIEKEGHRRFAMLDIVKAQTKQGDFKGAFNSALVLKEAGGDDDASGYESAVAEVLAELTKSGRPKEAKEAVGNFEDLKHRRWILLGRIAWAQAEAGDIPGAKATMTSADPEPQRAARRKELLRLSQVPREHLSVDDQNRFQALHEMDGIVHWTLEAIAKAQARKGDIRGAVATADGFSQESYRSSLFRKIGAMEAQNDRVNQALSWARALPSTGDKVYALLGTAEGLSTGKSAPR